jgi:AraC-like DNA-binding protein
MREWHNRMYVHPHPLPVEPARRPSLRLDHATIGDRAHLGQATRAEHRHDVYHAVLYPTGRGSFMLRGAEVPFRAPYLVLCSPGDPHTFQGGDGDDSFYSEATFSGRDRSGAPLCVGWSELLRTRFGCPCQVPAHGPLDAAAAAEIGEALAELVRLGFSATSHAAQLLDVALDRLLVALFRALVVERERADGLDAVERARVLIEARLEEGVGLGELARAVGLSAKHLARAFKRRFGLPPVRYRRRAAMERAAILVRSTRLPLEDIGARLGIDDPAYFTRVFRSVHGVPPGAYRRRHLGGPGDAV